MKLIKRSLLVLVLFTALLALFGDSIGRELSLHVAAINRRQQMGKLTAVDKVQCSIFYNSMIYAGSLFYPEAAAILKQYIHGNGQDLYLEPGYLKVSPVVQQELRSMEVGETRTVRFRQYKDWRLSYAVNGFTLQKKKNKALLHQKIIFLKDERVVTDLNFYLFKVRVPDGLVHALEPKPFTVYSEWEL